MSLALWSSIYRVDFAAKRHGTRRVKSIHDGKIESKNQTNKEGETKKIESLSNLSKK